MNSDPIIFELDVIARLLEAAGYAVEADYTGATIIVWLDVWPVLIELKRGRTGSQPVRQQVGQVLNLSGNR